MFDRVLGWLKWPVGIVALIFLPGLVYALYFVIRGIAQHPGNCAPFLIGAGVYAVFFIGVARRRVGFWTVLDYWLRRTEEFLTEQWVANRVAMIGRYDTGLGLRRPIDRLMRSEDPYGTLEFVEFGVRRG